MKGKTILIGTMLGITAYFGGSTYYNKNEMNHFLEAHKEFHEYKYLELYQTTLDSVLESYSKNAIGSDKELAEKTEKNLQLAIVHLEQQKMFYDQKKIAVYEHEWKKLADKRERDELFLLCSGILLSATLLWMLWNRERQK